MGDPGAIHALANPRFADKGRVVSRHSGDLGLGKLRCDLADGARNRYDHLACMFGRISARLGKLPIEKNSPRVSDLVREELSKFFRLGGEASLAVAIILAMKERAGGAALQQRRRLPERGASFDSASYSPSAPIA